MSTKSEYYTPYLTHTLWRSAYEAILATDRLTLMGYSMPKTDGAGTELLSGVSDSATVSVVDPAPGSHEFAGSLAFRAGRLNGTPPRLWAGINCVSDYVAERRRVVPDLLQTQLRVCGADDVVFALPLGHGMDSAPHYFTLVDNHDGTLSARDVDPNAVRQTGMSPKESALNILPPGMNELADFLTADTLLLYLERGAQPLIRFNDEVVLAVNSRRVSVWGKSVVMLYVVSGT